MSISPHRTVWCSRTSRPATMKWRSARTREPRAVVRYPAWASPPHSPWWPAPPWCWCDQGCSWVVPSGTGSMSDQLRSLPSFPLGEPYSALGYSYTGAPGTTTISPALLAQGGIDAIVDWVVVELRAPSSPFTVLGSRPALLQRDGDVVALDGTSALSFNLAAGNYRMSVLHRNHLGAMTAGTLRLVVHQYHH